MKARVQNTPSPALWLYTPGEGHEKTALAVMAAASGTGAAFHPFGHHTKGRHTHNGQQLFQNRS